MKKAHSQSQVDLCSEHLHFVFCFAFFAVVCLFCCCCCFFAWSFACWSQLRPQGLWVWRSKMAVTIPSWIAKPRDPGDKVVLDCGQSRAQSFSGSLSAVDHREKLWDNGISSNIP